MEIYENLFQGSDEPETLTRTHEDFQPLNDLVLVRRYQEDNTKAGSFIIPEKFRQQSNRGTTVAIGDKVVARLNVGDLVTFGIYNAETISINGEELLLIRENDIRGFERAL
jgi:chaperonin GroES